MSTSRQLHVEGPRSRRTRRSRRSGSLLTALVLLSSIAVTFSRPAAAIPSTEGTLSFFAGNGSYGNPTAGSALSSPYQGPASVIFDAAGNLYVADPNASVVTKIAPDGTQSIVAGIPGSAGAPSPGLATSSHLNQPYGLAFDSLGNLYIADSSNNRIEKVTPGGVLSVFAGTGSGGAVQPGAATSSPIDEPGDVAVDADDNVYVAVYDTYQIVKITPSGTLSVLAGNGSYGTPTPGTATSSPTGGSFGLVVDHAGNVIALDYDFCVIEKVTPGGVLSIYGGNGTCGPLSEGSATATPLGYFYGKPAIDYVGNLYFGDNSSQVVAKITPAGAVSIVAGTQGVSGTPSQGPALSSSLGQPQGIAVDHDGNLYVADELSHYVVKVTMPTVPLAPSTPVAAVSNGTVTATWSAPTSGPAPTSYTVTPIVNGVPSSPVTGVTSSPYVIAHPTAGATYAFEVAAVNGNGTSEASAASNTVTSSPTTVPISGITTPLHIGADGTVTTVPVTNAPDPSRQLTASTPSGSGSWTLAPDGGIFTAGDAGFFGSHGGSPMNAPAVGLAPTSTGSGYYIAGADGGVFAYGDAAFRGSMGGQPLNSPVTGISTTCTSAGYYLVAGDGGVFSYGDAEFYGSMAGTPLNRPMTGIVDACGQHGYWTFAKDGGVFAYGDAGFYGSLGAHPPAGGITGMVSASDGLGYWLIGTDHHVYAFGSVAH